MLSPVFNPEQAFVVLGVVAYLLAALAAWAGVVVRKPIDRLVQLCLGLAVTACLLAIVIRWQQTGNGPFLTLYEVLLSNLFSLGLIFAVVFYLVPRARPASLLLLPMLGLLGVWTLDTDPAPLELPATYDTALLWIHVGVGKVFLGMNMVAVGLAALIFARRLKRDVLVNSPVAADEELDDLAWRFMAVAFVFHSLMLIAGAVWAQDAWGRFWAWDSLETWAFITWLFMALSLHLRITWRIPRWSGSLLIFGVFILAFLTFFGVPFTSVGPHKGIL
ncbi:MAG: cytochrome c biogenesis protein CcsA [Thiotrichales bacterium]|nr:MAG: cytochrome c biogenesis protein CcsA [Thiotrichales bacterium]